MMCSTVRTQPAGDLPPGRRTRAAEQRAEPGAGLRLGLQRLAGVDLRHSSRARCCTATPFQRSSTCQRPESGLDRDRRYGRGADGKRKVTNVGWANRPRRAARHAAWRNYRHHPPEPHSAGTGRDQGVQRSGFPRTTAALNAYAGGQLKMERRHLPVRMPDRGATCRARGAAQVNTAARSYSVTFGYGGAFTATPRGLVPAVINAGTVADDPTNGACSLATPNAKLIPVTFQRARPMPASRSSIPKSTPASDLDLRLRTRAAPSSASGGATSAEEVNLLESGGGHLYRRRRGPGRRRVRGRSSCSRWALGCSAAGNMTVTAQGRGDRPDRRHQPHNQRPHPGTKYLGSVVYGGVAGMPNPTIVRVDTP